MTTTPKLKNPEVTNVAERPTFKELYLAAFGNLHSQFERLLWCDSHGHVHIDWSKLNQESPGRSKVLAKIAWNSAMEACALFEEQETIETFNRKITHAK